MFRKYVPTKHAMQLMQQMIVLDLTSLLYILETVFNILYVILIQVDSSLLSELLCDVKSEAQVVVKWAHQNDTFPDFYSLVDKAMTIRLWTGIRFGEW